jgi:hypothetical protein
MGALRHRRDQTSVAAGLYLFKFGGLRPAAVKNPTDILTSRPAKGVRNQLIIRALIIKIGNRLAFLPHFDKNNGLESSFEDPLCN